MRVSMLNAVLFAGLLSLHLSCSTSDKNQADDRQIGDGRDREDRGSRRDAVSVSSRRATLITSLSNNKLTPHTVSRARADREVGKLSSANPKDVATLEGRLSAERLAGKSLGQVMGTARKIASLKLGKNPNGEISENVKLEIALTAVKDRKFSLAEYYLQDLTNSKNARIRAGSYNGLGVVALKDERVPEAVAYFRQSLKALGSYEPALLNLGLVALGGGDLQTAKRSFSNMQDDLVVQTALVSIERLSGNANRIDSLCERILKKDPSHKSTLFNCGLHEYQAKANFDRAKQLLNEAARAPGGEAGWDRHIGQMIAKVSLEHNRLKRVAAKKKTDARELKEKAKVDKEPNDGSDEKSRNSEEVPK